MAPFFRHENSDTRRHAFTGRAAAAALLAVAASSLACAHSASAGTNPKRAADAAAGPSREAASPPAPSGGSQAYHNDYFGCSFELPADAGFSSGTDQNVLAQAPDGSSIRIVNETLDGRATTDACWARIFERMSKVPDRPQSIAELRDQASRGMVRGDRRVFLMPFTRDNSCLVLVAEGPRDSDALTAAVPAALRTFRVGAPSRALQADARIEAATQLLADKKYDESLRLYEDVLKENPDRMDAEFGAGLAAYLAGPATAARAVEHLNRVVSTHPQDDSDSEGEQPSSAAERFQDGLMYLGLAYASLKQYKQASVTLAELVDRFPDDAVGRYNFACVLALSGDSDEALDQLRGALQRKPDLADHAREDEDLLSLHATAAWKELLGDAAPPGRPADHQAP